MWYVGPLRIVDNNHGLVFSLFFFIVLAVIIVSTRIYTRLFVIRILGVDDVLIVIATFGSIGFLTSTLYQIKYGLGDAVILPELSNFLIALYATVVSYGFTQLAIKFSLLFQYRRIFNTATARRIFLMLLCWLSLYALFCMGTSIFTCWPVAKYWDDSIPGGCIDRSILHYVIAGFNIMNDFILLALPLPFLRKLQINLRDKIALIGVFACGGFACIVAIIRLQSLYVNNSAPIPDQPLKGVDIALWSGLEINIAIATASVPSLKALMVRIFPRLGSSFKSSSGIGNMYGARSGSRPLRSVDKKTGNRFESSSSPAGQSGSSGANDKMEIKVENTIELRTIAIGDGDDSWSEKNLVTNAAGASWVEIDGEQRRSGRKSSMTRGSGRGSGEGRR